MTRCVVYYIGNFRHAHCTETHVARALTQDLGCEILHVQQETASEMRPGDFAQSAIAAGADLVLYTRTHNVTALTGERWHAAWRTLETAGVQTASLHLDRFWDLDREHLIHDQDPLFTVRHVFTADGGNQERWTAAGVHHHWLPPAVDRVEAETPGRIDRRFQADIVFVGSATDYHGEYEQRRALIDHLRLTYGRRFRWVGPGRGPDTPVVRGQRLNDVYASARVVVGDSCFANEEQAPRSTRYWSDRVPETLGRGGFLLHPYVPGIRDAFSPSELACYAPGDWADLDAQIGAYLANEGERAGFVERGRRRVLAEHTYTHRARTLLETCGLPVPADEGSSAGDANPVTSTR